MNIMNVDNLTKSYGEKVLFSNISFSVNDGDKIGIIGVNGTGKSSLLKIIAGVDVPDEGSLTSKSNITIEYLSQDPEFDPNATVLEQVFKSNSKIMRLIQRYEETMEHLIRNPKNESLQNLINTLSEEMTALDGWELESRVKTILSKLGITGFGSKMNTLSGGQQKRVALSAALIAPCDLLILDEPTNHMDNSTIDWLETYLEGRKGALLMITHDRYFLDRVVNKTIEMENGSIYSYPGNYTYFVEKRIERRSMASTMERKRQNLYKRELVWIRAGCPARTTKQKSRIQRFETLEDQKFDFTDEIVDISLGQSRLGKKVMTIENLSKKFGDMTVIDNFSYTFLREDRVGIIGDNGSGKSTLLNIISGKLAADSGIIDIGTTVKMGYFSQRSDELDGDLRAIDYIKEGAEFVETSDGSKISASQMMERFLFSSDMQWNYIRKLSGGEKRRLYLLRILMDSPNVLILDEPTNDLDIDSLKVLESYIDDFDGVVISVSHDRYFLDRTCERIFSYEGNGKILEHTGNYSDYKKFKETLVDDSKEKKVVKEITSEKSPKRDKLKFTYKEKIEFESIEAEIEALESKLDKIHEDMNKFSHDFEKLNSLMKEKESIEENLLNKMERFEYLNELNTTIMNQDMK